MAKEAKRSFQYNRRDREDVKTRANMRGGGLDTWVLPELKKYKVRDGKNLIRILPPTWPDAKHYGFDIFVNYGVGPDNGQYLSLSKMKGEPDPLAEARRMALKEGNEKVAKALNPTQRVLMWIIDRQDEDEGPQLWDAPQTVDKAIANICMDPDTKEVVYLDDPEEGCDLRFYREGKGMNVKYDGSQMKLLKPSLIHEDEGLMHEWLDYIQDHPVPDCLKFYDFDHISTVFDGQVRTNDDDDEGEKKPARSRPTIKDESDEDKPARAKAANPWDEDEDAKPASRSTSRKTQSDDDGEAPAPRTGSSIRERLAARHKATADASEDD